MDCTQLLQAQGERERERVRGTRETSDSSLALCLSMRRKVRREMLVSPRRAPVKRAMHLVHSMSAFLPARHSLSHRHTDTHTNTQETIV